ncbi:MAG: glycosyltransferase family 2 protein [Oscillospiraceae bacterium]|nr:glycosyltransferase family 2 protein [Oscillospiraceae bacterium]
MSQLYIVVPCYNEEEALPLTAPVFLKKLMALCPTGRIVLVDDGSQDTTWDIIRSLHEGDGHFTGLKLDRNRGHQNALTAGLMWARTRCDATISIDADLQDDIDAMDGMWTEFRKGANIVCGYRTDRSSDSFLKRFTAEGYYTLMRLLGSDLIYNHADYRLLDASAMEALSRYHEDDLFLRGLVKRLGGNIATVGYERRAREAGESKYTLKKMLKLAAKGFTCGRLRPRPTSREVKYIAEVLHCDTL